MKNIYQHNIELEPIRINNADKATFSQKLSDGRKIVITKPGGKSVYGRPKKEDFLVFIYNPNDNTLWQISHKQILEDVINKVQENKDKAKVFLTLMEKTYNGEEPSPEALIKVYKWIWGQEDVNYPTGEGRLMSWKEYQEIIAKL